MTGKPRVVTLGGGHGQAALLSALVPIACEIAAVVSIADDGGCSGQLRDEVGMPPPGDLRRCLTTLAKDRELAERFEFRWSDGDDAGRSAGNLAISEAFQDFGSLQKAVDWAASLLQCRGRVIPAAESAGVLAVYDLNAGAVEGESNVEKSSSAPMVASVHGPEKANPVATEAILSADYLFMGPGSFVTSTLAAITTAEVGEAIAKSAARKVLIANLGPEKGHTEGFRLADYVRLLRDHLSIASGDLDVSFDVLAHGASSQEPRTLEDGTSVYEAPLVAPERDVHDPTRLTDALVACFDLRRRPLLSAPPPSRPGERADFEEHLLRAQTRLRSRG